MNQIIKAKRRILIIVGILLTGMFILSGCASAPQESSPTAVSGAGASLSTRTEFVATAPSTVKLASGKVQLIEFFAFW